MVNNHRKELTYKVKVLLVSCNHKFAGTVLTRTAVENQLE